MLVPVHRTRQKREPGSKAITVMVQERNFKRPKIWQWKWRGGENSSNRIVKIQLWNGGGARHEEHEDHPQVAN